MSSSSKISKEAQQTQKGRKNKKWQRSKCQDRDTERMQHGGSARRSSPPASGSGVSQQGFRPVPFDDALRWEGLLSLEVLDGAEYTNVVAGSAGNSCGSRASRGTGTGRKAAAIDSTGEPATSDASQDLNKGKKKKKKRRRKKKRSVLASDGGAGDTAAKGNPRKRLKGISHLSVTLSDVEVGARNNAACRDLKLKSEALSDADIAASLPEWSSYGVHPALLRGIHALGFQMPTPIQGATLTPAMRDWQDIIGAAETGSGKTLAFGLPIIHRFIVQQQLQSGDEEKSQSEAKPFLAALVITPTRELALQIVEHLRAVSRFVSWPWTPSASASIVAIVGGMSEQKQRRVLAKCPPIVVGTPGRIWRLMDDGHSHLARVGRLSAVVLDEADRMVAGGHFPELTSILQFIETRATKLDGKGTGMDDFSMDELVEEVKPSESTSSAAAAETAVIRDSAGAISSHEQNQRGINDVRRQIFLFSATLTMNEEGRQKAHHKGAGKGRDKNRNISMVEKLGQRFVKGRNGKFAVVDLSRQEQTVKALDERAFACAEADKDSYLYYYLHTHQGRTLVFVNSIASLRRLVPLLNVLSVRAYGLHAQMQQRQRLRNLDRFRAHDDVVIVCTDVAARGIDIRGVQHVVHYQLPHTADTYVHRCGRTARAGGSGSSVALVGESEEVTYRSLCRNLNRGPLGIPDLDVDAEMYRMLKAHVKQARIVESLEHEASKSKSDGDWHRRAAEEAGIMLESDEEDAFASRGRKKIKRREGRRTGVNKAAARAKKKLIGEKQKLAELLSEPLVRRSINRTFFTVNDLSGKALMSNDDGAIDLEALKR